MGSRLCELLANWPKPDAASARQGSQLFMMESEQALSHTRLISSLCIAVIASASWQPFTTAMKSHTPSAAPFSASAAHDSQQKLSTPSYPM